MLILARGMHEELIIGTGPDAVTIRVLGFDKVQGVKLGIPAPATIRVDRIEVHNRRANGTPPLPRRQRNGEAH